MKKFWILIVMAMAVITSCGQEILDSGSDVTETAPIVFNLTANHPDDTKAVKTGWKNGDAIFVFFDRVAAPKYLKMTYDGTGWTCAEMNGGLGLKNEDSGTMRAVFLPFGSDATVSASGTSFTFNTTYYAYYLTATLPYTVTNHTVSGSFIMEIPDGYVQFFIDDADATDGGYTLATDAVIPVGVASIDRDGNIVTMTKNAGDDMIGYAYGTGNNKGYLFSGKMVSSYSYKGYYFAKTKVADKTRCDYFVTGKKLESHMSVKLPVNSSEYRTYANYGGGKQNAEGKWIPVGKDIYVDLMRKNTEGSYIIIGGRSWATCNYGQSVPEAYGSLYRFCDISQLKTSLPAKYLFDFLTNKDPNQSYFSYTKLTVHGQIGYVIQAERGFIFLPATASSYCEYWSSDEFDNANAWYCRFTGKSGDCMYYKSSTHDNSVCAVRLVK